MRGLPLRATALSAVALCAAPRAATAQVHGHVGVGPALLLTGAGGDATRWTVAGELLGRGRWGGGAALHALGGRGQHGLAVLRLAAQLGAAPPKLWLRGHVEAGLSLAARDPVAGLGATVTLRVWRGVALVVETDAHLVVRGVADTRLTLSAATLAAVAW
ncbi:MAG: hypothetical protein R3B48_11410 [Kofleriaceae bacterium]